MVRALEKSLKQNDTSMKFRVRVAYDSNQASPFVHPDRVKREKRVLDFFRTLA